MLKIRLLSVALAVALAFILGAGSVAVAAPPPGMPHAFYGSVTIGTAPAPNGATVSAHIGSLSWSTTTTSGKYGYSPAFLIPADDPATPAKDGGVNGDLIIFKVNGTPCTPATSYTFLTGSVTKLDLAIAGVSDIPDISVSPTSKNFGNVTVGSSSSPQTFTVSNVGTANLVIGTVTLTGTNAGEFSKQNDNCSVQTITPSASATLQVVFSPTSTGAKSATLSIPSNDPDEATVTVSLSGTGVSVTPPPPAPTHGVGGTAYPPDKLAILTPWIAVLAVLLAGGITWLVLRRRRAY